MVDDYDFWDMVEWETGGDWEAEEAAKELYYSTEVIEDWEMPYGDGWANIDPYEYGQ